jgi:hypothetical protein
MKKNLTYVRPEKSFLTKKWQFTIFIGKISLKSRSGWEVDKKLKKNIMKNTTLKIDLWPILRFSGKKFTTFTGNNSHFNKDIQICN